MVPTKSQQQLQVCIRQYGSTVRAAAALGWLIVVLAFDSLTHVPSRQDSAARREGRHIPAARREGRHIPKVHMFRDKDYD